MTNQSYFKGNGAVSDFIACLKKTGNKLFIVSGESCIKLPIVKKIISEMENTVCFSNFTPNPTYESVQRGVDSFKDNVCDIILAVGGGSAIDVAKCIKLFSTMDSNKNYLQQPFLANKVPLFAIPTTAGTGSEATRFAVIYFQGNKQSVTHDSIIPQAVLFDASLLESIPDYHRKATMLDALCHAIESFWSINSTKESRKYATQAIEIFFDAIDLYMKNNSIGNEEMMRAANLAGKAINISQTTAAHAMCYKLTSLCGLAHGHAVSIILPELWDYMLDHMQKCIDNRGKKYLDQVFVNIAIAMRCQNAKEAVEKLRILLQRLGMKKPNLDEEEIKLLVSSVNPIRLKNNPIELAALDIECIYQKISEK